ncbi:MAG: coenzyme synthesis protein PqqD [Gemmatimonadetes bacterium]|nr:coenzyme synthesis protein PqqD [Gemmatimonadota bacterium]
MTPMQYTVPEDVLAAHLAGEAVLLDVETKQYYRLNATAAHVWKGLERGLGRDALLADLLASFEVEPSVAEAELERLLADLSERRLVRTAGPDAAP